MIAAHPPLQRRPMLARRWAGAPLRRLLRGLIGGAPESSAAVGIADRRPLMVRRIALLALVGLGALVGTQAMAEVLPERGAALAEKGLLGLFGVLFAWISAGFWTGLMGAWTLVRGRDGGPLMRGLSAAPLRPLDPLARTAIVMPICNEHVPTVFGGLAATVGSLIATGESANFDVYVLSDSNDAEIRVAEHAAWSDFAGRVAACAEGDAAALRVHYRWRQQRVKRKAGNIADFCRRWGAAYRYLIVLDADSVMTGDCLTTLVRTMEAHPDAGIVQTAPKAFGHDTFHARVQQFCASAYGPLFTAGMRFWQLGESHYWGHNAIIRREPFMAHCALAPLPGDGPLAGEIMSHDFVEAALMRRAGWKVWVADEIRGSYEQVPPNLLAELQRDRRWCHGNLQNSRLMFEPRLHAVHRTAFLTGVLAYASSPFWLAFLLLSTLLFAQHAGSEPAYFVEAYQLFPIWPTVNLKLMLTLFGLTGVLLLAPKVLSLIAIVLRGDSSRFGGTARLLASAFIEFWHSLLLAPVRMVFHTQFVVAALTGWRLDWKSPPRHDQATSWRRAWAGHGLHTMLAVLWIGAILATSPVFPWWLAPILAGLLAAMPLSVWGSRAEVGRALRRRGLLLTPEERRLPGVLRATERESAAVARATTTLANALADPRQHERIVVALPQRGVPTGAKALAEEQLVERALAESPESLAAADGLRIVSSRSALARIRSEALAGRAHPGWWLGSAEFAAADAEDATMPPAAPAAGRGRVGAPAHAATSEEIAEHVL